MKLICCPICFDLVRLTTKQRSCYCGVNYGYYKHDGLNAVVSEGAVPIGVANSDIETAVQRYPARATSIRMWVDGPTTNPIWEIIKKEKK